MKWMFVAVVATLSQAAFAADACEASCVDTVRQCADMCKKSLKGDQADKVKFCQDKCKEFESECKKDCKEDSKR